MKKNLTEIVFILDRSGSMAHLTEDTIGGFNAMLERQKQEEGEAYVSIVLFSTDSVVLHDRLPIREVPAMTRKDYCAAGCTALMDAVGGAVRHIANIHKYARPEDVPQRTLFVITTDGMENASRRYGAEEVRRLIDRQKECGWEFLFLGANIDAAETAGRIGINAGCAVDYVPDAAGTQKNFAAMSDAICEVRRSRPVGTAWRAGVDQDFASRGGR